MPDWSDRAPDATFDLHGQTVLEAAANAERFLRAFASSARSHYTEQGLRLLVGAALVNSASAMRYPGLFTLFGWLIVRSALLPRTLGLLGILNAVLLVILYFASAGELQSLVLISGGLTSLIVGPVWWIWLGLNLLRRVETA